LDYSSRAERGCHLADPIKREVLNELEADGCQFFHMAEDPAEAKDVAVVNPGAFKPPVRFTGAINRL
jgi:hypothetical protein